MKRIFNAVIIINANKLLKVEVLRKRVSNLVCFAQFNYDAEQVKKLHTHLIF